MEPGSGLQSGCSLLGPAAHVPQQQSAVPKQRPQLCFQVGAGGGELWWGPRSHPSTETGMGVAQPAWQPSLCFERNVLVGGGAVLIQTWLRRPLPAHLGRWGWGHVLGLLVPSTHEWCVQWLRPLPLYVALLTFLYSSLWRENRRLPSPWGEPQPRMAVGGRGPPRAPSRLWWASSAGSGFCRRAFSAAGVPEPHDSPGSSCYYQFSLSSLTGSRSRKILA